ncbi:cuticle protein AM1199-like [Macrobrachium rosenbergii]|uniref:cuticle protein AM1199-like n=1 Tax=Macrobrachium rosenbergii TaxID=79674 RepID=UPI0034D39682
MKLIIFACLAAVALAAPQFLEADTSASIEKDERFDLGDGNFRYAFELSDGTVVEASGTPGEEGGVNIEGSYRYVHPDGDVVEITYVADERGFRPVGDVIPTPHPLPAHAIEQIRFAEERRALGETFE